MSFPAAIWLLKVVTGLASLGCVALVWACATRLGRPPLPATLFFGLNPILLAYAVGGAHNDLLMLAAALGGIYLMLAGRESGMAALVASVAVKSSSVVLLPFALLGSRRPLRALLWGRGRRRVVGVITLIAFGHPRLEHAARAPRRRAAGDAERHPGRRQRRVRARHQHRAPGQDRDAPAAADDPLLLVRVYRGGNWLENAGWATCAVIVTTTWFLPWYLIWFLPLAALAVQALPAPHRAGPDRPGDRAAAAADIWALANGLRHKAAATMRPPHITARGFAPRSQRSGLVAATTPGGVRAVPRSGPR